VLMASDQTSGAGKAGMTDSVKDAIPLISITKPASVPLSWKPD